MEEEARQYVLHRFKTMSYFSNSVPYEHPPHLIRSDMEKARMSFIPTEEEIEEVLSEAKSNAKNKILSMLRDGKRLAEIRDWCEYSLECPVPILPVSSVSMNQLLSRYDYFNYEINRMIREEQISLALKERRETGAMFDPVRLTNLFESMGITDISDEFTKVETMTPEEISELVEEAEENSKAFILKYVLDDLPQDEIMERLSEGNNMAFSKSEIPQIIGELVRRERFSIIAREVARMDTSEMWNLINNIESYKIYRLSRISKEGRISEIQHEDQMLELLKLYEQGKDSLKEGYIFQVSKLTNIDLSHLIRLIRGFISWRGAFYYLPANISISNEKELSRLIIEGFSHENGMDPEIFRMFLMRKQH